MAAVDFHAEFDADNLAALEAARGTLRVPAGSVVQVNEDGKYELGVGTDSVMPLFTFNASDDPDVSNDGGDAATEKGVFIAISPTGQAMALVAIGAYELVSTAYVTANAADMVPNAKLTSADSGANAGNLDVADNDEVYDKMIVGIVSRGIVDNGYGHDAVAFWPFPIFPDLRT
jgi:hypothetical protein